MNKLRTALLTLLTFNLMLPIGYSSLRGLLLQMGFSWTISEWAYYIVLLIVGVLWALLLPSASKSLVGWKRRMVQVVLALAPFIIGFAQHPIYEDMVWDLSHDMLAVQPMPDYADANLVVIAIADCPYCKRAVSEMKALHERNPNMAMRMVVCTADSTWLEPYVQEANDAFEVIMASDMDMLATHAGGHFPAYVLVRNGKPVCRWSNNEWGPLAKDAVERTQD
jgi:glutaredoxin